jgi:hypothetical protein
VRPGNVAGFIARPPAAGGAGARSAQSRRPFADNPADEGRATRGDIRTSRKRSPIGLGLLAVVAVPVAGIGIALGAIKLIVERFAQARR